MASVEHVLGYGGRGGGMASVEHVLGYGRGGGWQVLNMSWVMGGGGGNGRGVWGE